MAPKRKNDHLTAEEKLELQRERNRVKQANLRARRAARLKELEEENAKLQDATPRLGASLSAARAAADAPAPTLQPGTAGYDGALGRAVGKLRELGVSEGEILALVLGSDEGSAQAAATAQPKHVQPSVVSSAGQSRNESPAPAQPPPSFVPPEWPALASALVAWSPGFLNGATTEATENHSSNSSSSSSSSAAGSTPPSQHAGAVNTQPAPFPFSFLFPDSTPIAACSEDPSFAPGDLSLSVTCTALPASSSSSTSSSSSNIDFGDSPNPCPSALSAASSSTSTSSPSAPLEPLVVPDISIDFLQQGIEALFEKLKGGPKRVGGREGLFKSPSERVESEKDMAATQLLILQLLGATSSQKAAYDAQCTMTPREAWLLQHGDFDPRVHYVPNPAFRVRLGEAAKLYHLNLTHLFNDMINNLRICGDAWDWTGWAMPPDFMLQLPVNTGAESKFFPSPVDNWRPKNTALRPRPSYLTGSTIREIILGLEKPGAREAGPFATSCTVQLVEGETVTYTHA